MNQANSKNESSVASHSCTSGNSIEQAPTWKDEWSYAKFCFEVREYYKRRRTVLNNEKKLMKTIHGIIINEV